MKRSFWLGILAMLCLAALTPAAEEQDAANTLPQGGIAGAVPIEVDATRATYQLESKNYFLGIECDRVPKALRVHLNLPEGQGLIVVRVIPESPAAKAGLAPHDILLKADGRKLEHFDDLIESVNQARDKPLALDLLHAGVPKTLQITPVKRSRDAAMPMPSHHAEEAWKQLEQALQGLRAKEAMQSNDPRVEKNLKFRFFGPGAIVPGAGAMALPGNLSISISKTGGQPAEIVVKKDNQKWIVTEKDLDKLPDDVRPHVERMLGGISMGATGQIFNFVPNVTIPAPPPDLNKTLQLLDKTQQQLGPARERLENQLKEMDRRMEEIRKKFDTDMQRHLEKMRKQLDALEERNRQP